MPTLTLVRVPNRAESVTIANLVEQEQKATKIVFSTEHPRKRQHAHDCLNQAIASMHNGNNTVVSISSAPVWELNAYLEVARHAQCDVTIIN